MTHPALTAEQRAARIERDIATSKRFAAVYTQAAKREIARIAELNQLLAELGSKQVTPRQIERYPVLSHAPCPYCHSPLKVSDERYPARRLSEAELAEMDEEAAGETLLTVPMGGEVGKCPCGSDYCSEPHAEASP